MLLNVLMCLSAFLAGINGECVDWLAKCDLLAETYCSAPYDVLARQVCAKRCGLCDDNNISLNKRGHQQPDWISHCWDNAPNKIEDPFCEFLTTTTTPKPSTTTTTEAQTTTTTEPTTTTTAPTTTTTEPSTTTTEPSTTTTTLPPTTTQRVCNYEEYNETDIRKTDFGTDMALAQNTNITLNESVHLIGDVSFCQGVCAQSLLNDGFECWAFTFNEIDRCYLYYYNRPLQVLELTVVNNASTLYVKRCSDDPVTTRQPSAAPVNTDAPGSTAAPSGSPVTGVTQTPSGTTDQPAGTTQAPAETSGPSGNETSPTDGNMSGVGSTAPAGTGLPPVTTTSAASSGTTAASSGTGPDTSQGPGSGPEMINQTLFKSSGVRSPVPNTCYFENRTFAKGQHWNQTCRFDCECIDTDTNTELCGDMCPHYSSIPPNCILRKVDGECCPKLECANSTQGSVNVSDCHDTLDTCDWYEDNACIGPYEPWARAHCPLRCGYCDYKPPCVDRITYCDFYDLDTACTDYRGWARYNCKQSCNLCI